MGVAVAAGSGMDAAVGAGVGLKQAINADRARSAAKAYSFDMGFTPLIPNWRPQVTVASLARSYHGEMGQALRKACGFAAFQCSCSVRPA
jgi:hypothetical protein